MSMSFLDPGYLARTLAVMFLASHATGPPGCGKTSCPYTSASDTHPSLPDTQETGSDVGGCPDFELMGFRSDEHSDAWLLPSGHEEDPGG